MKTEFTSITDFGSRVAKDAMLCQFNDGLPAGFRGITDSMLEPKGPNAAQIQFWNETAGQKWVNYQVTINAHARPFGLLAMERPGSLRGVDLLS